MVSVGSSRDSRRQIDDDRRSNAGKSKGKFLGLRLKIGLTPVKIHLQKPKEPYKDYNSDVFFWWKRGRSMFAKTESAPKGTAVEVGTGEDLVSAYLDPGAFGLDPNQLDKRARAFIEKQQVRTYYSVSGWLVQPHHLVEKQKEDRKTFYREVCAGKGCDSCKKNLPKVFGNRFYFDFSTAVWRDSILPILEKLERLPKDGGYLYPANYVCEACQTELIDMTGSCSSCASKDIGIQVESHSAVCNSCGLEWSLLEYADENLLNQVSQKMTCPNSKCRHSGYPQLVLVHSDGATEWETYDLFDIQMKIKKSGTDQKAPLVIESWEIKPPDPRLFDPASQGGGEVGEASVKKNMEPLDLNMIHAPEPPAVQAQKLGLPNPFAGPVTPHTVKKYSRGPKTPEPQDNEEENEESDE